MNKIFVAVIGVILVAGLLGLSSGPAAGPEQMVRIGDLPIVDGLPLYVALEKGYFAEEGLHVERVQFEAPNQIIDALLQDRIDFGSPSIALGITGIADHKNPGKLKIYAAAGGSVDHPKENLLVAPDSDIVSISDLSGKRLGILGGIQWRTIARELLAQHGLEMDKDVTIVELSPALQVQALASGQIDALLALEPMSTVAIQQGAGKIMISGPVEKGIANPFYGGAGVVRAAFAEEYPEQTAKVLRAFERAMDDIAADPAAHKQYLLGYTPLSEEVVQEVPIVMFRSCSDFTSDDIGAMQAFYDIFTKYGIVDGEIDPHTLLYCETE
ncbi:MAG: ABC transporter substrate-binding protein [Candidatus Aenigmarchaeota archaeon]|nr:ABC transporter substrate-binding protein [Candidatus Aenigmarchaeota archaeon]